MTYSDEAERDRCRGPFRAALKAFLLFATAWVLVSAVSTRNFYIFLAGMAVTWASLYYGWRTLWYGVSLVALAVPSTWRNVVQGGLVLLVWSGPLFYFIPTSSSLASIVERTSGWTAVMAGILGLLSYGLASVDTRAAFRLPVRPLLVAVAVVTVLCFMTKNEISLGTSDEEDVYPELDEPSTTSPDERAYLHYVVYSTFAVGGVLIALTRSHLTGAGPGGGRGAKMLIRSDR